ncbi:heme peroxidase [Acephala macrosclerotiorum]|nr:heme peroxidase [Acephala macrosclerotiorum]
MPSTADTSSAQPGAWRKEVEQTLETVQQLISKSAAPIPTNPYAPSNELDAKKMTSLLTDLRKMGFQDVETLLALFNSQVKGSQDDNKFVLEHLVQLLAKLDDSSKIADQLSGGFINGLWNALPHPPMTGLGTKYQYREPDGSNNNIRFPDLGKAKTPYARSAKPTILQNIALPDPGAIFDSLMVRGDEFQPHPNKISSMLFYLATIIIHDAFRTNHADFNQSDTSSYLDLAPLYGSVEEEQKLVRTFEDGKLKPDCFSEKRLLGFPPGVCVMLVMFNRFHNYVVTQLAAINENGRFTKPKDQDPKKLAAYDNDLFQTGRLITCGLYVNCVLKDYVRTILNLNRTSSKWDLDPRTEEGKTLFNSPAAEGTGNQVSAEFNLIYRWHSAVSKRDDEWTQGAYAKLFPGKKAEEVGLDELLRGLIMFEKTLGDDPLAPSRDFGGLKRQEDGSYNDDDLVKILTESIEDVAGSFGANRVPKILKSVEILGIIQARSWNIASLNEFREFTGLQKHATFEDINPDPAVAEKLRNLYDNPDFVEMYPGLVAEKAKPPMAPGSGLCVNFTTSYAILSDAVGLVRGDRFYTIDYTPRNLTNWGYNEVQYDTSVDEGCVFYKVILRAFPNHFKADSIYAHFPFVIPSENLVIQKSLNRAEKYSWDAPARQAPVVVLDTYASVTQALHDSASLTINGTPANASVQSALAKGLYPKDWQSEVKKFYSETTAKLLKTYAYAVPGTTKSQVDIVRDVANLVNARFASSVFSLPIKTEESPLGVYTEQEMYQILLILYTATFDNRDIAKAFQISGAADMLLKQMGELVLLNAEAISSSGLIADVLASLHKPSGGLTEYGTHLIQTLVNSKVPVKDVVFSHLLPAAATLTTTQSQLFSQAFDYYLGAGASHLPKLYQLAQTNTKEADDTLTHYFLEGARLTTTTRLTRLSPKGRTTILDLSTASLDANAYPDPGSLDLKRPVSSYLLFGDKTFQDLSLVAMTAMFKTVFSLKGLQRVVSSLGGYSGRGGGWVGWSQGEIKSVTVGEGTGVVEGGLGKVFLSEDWRGFVVAPTTMKVQFDA